MQYRHEFLSAEQFPQIYRTFVEAFADYYVDTSGVTETMLYNRAIKNGVDFGLCVGAFDTEKMVGVTIVGRDRWKGVSAAFDIGTGIVPAHRGKGLARRMFEFALPRLRELGVARFVLEVIQENEPAIKAYRAAGFEETREFDCFEWRPGEGQAAGSSRSAVEVRPVGRDLLADFEDHLDWTPSWENSFASIRRIPDDLVLYGAFAGEDTCAGVIAYYPSINWVPTLVVQRDHRRKGIAGALLQHLAENLPDSAGDLVKLVNIDHTDSALLGLMRKIGATPTVRQFEMELDF